MRLRFCMRPSQMGDNSTLPMKIAGENAGHVIVLLREEQIAAEFAAAFASGFLDEKFFYWLPPSVRAWCELCESPQYKNANRAMRLLKREASTIAGLARDVRTVCGLGCGEGSKDEVLLRAFEHPRRYLAADFSQALLELALARCAPLVHTAVGVKFDVAIDAHLAALAELGGAGHRLFAVLGNTLGAFGPESFPARLHQTMRPGDFALFDGEIFAGEETLRGYDHPDNRRFAFAPLAGLGLEEGRDGALRFELRSGQNELHEVVKYFEPARNLEIAFAGQKLQLTKGHRLRMSSSIKYDEATFLKLVEAEGFKLAHFARSEDAKFLLALVKRN